MYYLFIDEEQRGPFSIEQLAEMGITPETEVWTEGMDDWKQAGDVPQLTTLLQRLEYERHQAQLQPPARRPQPTHVPPLPPDSATAAPGPTPAKRSGSGIKWLIALLIACVLLGVMVVTCPDREAHRQAIVGSTREWVGEQVDQRDMGSNLLGELFKWLTGKGANMAIEQVLVVDNHFIYSTGKFAVGAEPKTVSVGLLGHVFTFSKEDISQALRQIMGIDQQQRQPSVGITPAPEPEPDEPLMAPDDSLGSVMPREEDEPYDEAQALIDSLARQAKDQAVKAAKEWVKKQIDNL